MSLIAAIMIIMAGVVPVSMQVATPAATPFACPTSTPNHVTPPAALEHYIDPASSFYMSGIWVTLPPDGRLYLSLEDLVAKDGELANWRATKLPWTRGEGVVGPLIVTGQRLDGDAPLAFDIAFDSQYGSMGFTPVSLVFPSPGCWQITGKVGDRTNTLTLEVVFVDTYPWLATPTG